MLPQTVFVSVTTNVPVGISIISNLPLQVFISFVVPLGQFSFMDLYLYFPFDISVTQTYLLPDFISKTGPLSMPLSHVLTVHESPVKDITLPVSGSNVLLSIIRCLSVFLIEVYLIFAILDSVSAEVTLTVV